MCEENVEFPAKEDYEGLSWYKVRYFWYDNKMKRQFSVIDVIALNVSAAKDLIEDGGGSGFTFVAAVRAGSALEFYKTGLVDESD